MACQTMLAGMKFFINGTQNSHDLLPVSLEHVNAMKPLETTSAVIRKFLFLYKIRLDVG